MFHRFLSNRHAKNRERLLVSRRRLFVESLESRRMLAAVGVGNAEAENGPAEVAPMSPIGTARCSDHGCNAGSATSVSINSATRGKINSLGDEDYFSFTAPIGNITIEVALETLSGSMLTLYDGANQIAFDDDGGLGQSSRIAITNGVPEATYHVKVEAYNDLSVGHYTLYVDNGITIEDPSCAYADVNSNGRFNFDDWCIDDDLSDGIVKVRKAGLVIPPSTVEVANFDGDVSLRVDGDIRIFANLTSNSDVKVQSIRGNVIFTDVSISAFDILDVKAKKDITSDESATFNSFDRCSFKANGNINLGATYIDGPFVTCSKQLSLKADSITMIGSYIAAETAKLKSRSGINANYSNIFATKQIDLNGGRGLISIVTATVRTPGPSGIVKMKATEIIANNSTILAYKKIDLQGRNSIFLNDATIANCGNNTTGDIKITLKELWVADLVLRAADEYDVRGTLIGLPIFIGVGTMPCT